MLDSRDFAVIGGIFALLVGLLIWTVVKDEKEWRQFADEHECEVIGRMTGSVTTGFSGNGAVVTGYSTGKTGYKCNNGMTYWR